jgi:predicted phosphodiesterase
MGVRPKAGRSSASFGIFTDTHYADTDTVGSRFYRDSLDKLNECIELMNARRVDFLIEIGDFKDQDNPAVEQRTISYLQAVEKIFQQFKDPTYHVVGNHDVDSISKTQFLTRVKNTGIGPDQSYYSFDFNGLHFVVLDANYRADGVEYNRGNFDWSDTNIPPAELDWLKHDLKTTNGPAIVFVHQLLDGTGPVYVNNAEEVQQVLEQSGNVLCVFQGHHHPGSYSYIRKTHYYTLKAMVEGPGPDNNSYAIVDVGADHSITITGYRTVINRRLAAVSAPAASLAIYYQGSLSVLGSTA